MFNIKKSMYPGWGFFFDTNMPIFSSLEAKLSIGFVYSIHAHKDIDAYMKEVCYGMMCYTQAIID